MAISSTVARNQYTSAGQSSFTYTSEIFAATDLQVYADSTLKTYLSDYTISGVGSDTGGTVTFITAPAAGSVITIVRALPLTRAIDYQQSGSFTAANVNTDFDRLWAKAQELNDAQSRSLSLSDTDTTPIAAFTLPSVAARSSRLFGFDSTGGITTYPTSSGGAGADTTFLQSGTGAVGRVASDKLRETLSVLDFGAVPDARFVADFVCTSGSKNASAASGTFTSADVGKIIKFYRTSDDTYGGLTTIASVTGSTTITLASNAPISINSSQGGYAMFGFDQAPAIQLALNAARDRVNAAFIQYNIPAGPGQMRVFLPTSTTGAGYLLASQLTVYRNTILDADAMLYNALGNGTSDRSFALHFKAGASVDRLRLHAGWACGAIFGDVGVNSHGFINDLAVWSHGTDFNAALTPQNHTGCDFYGYDWSANRIWVKGQGANTGGTCVRMTNTSDVMIGRLFAIGAATGLQLDTCEQVMVSDANLDTLRYAAIVIDASHNIQINAQAFNNYDAAPSYALTYGLLLGEYSGTVNKSLRIRYSASVTGGTMMKVSNTANLQADLFASNGTQLTNNSGSAPVTLAVNYGGSLTGIIAIRAVLDSAITHLSGSRVGTYEVRQGSTVTNYPTQDGVAKAWGRINGSGVLQTTSFNIASTSRSSAGVYVFNFTTPFVDTNYTVVATTLVGSAGHLIGVSSQAAGSVTITDVNSATAAAQDGGISIVCFGLQ